MKSRSHWPLLYLLLLLAGATSFALLGDEPEVATANINRAPGTSIQMTGGKDLPDLVGSWTGTWHDTVYDVVGALTCVIEVDGYDLLAAGTIDLSYFGLGTQTGTATGLPVGNSMNFTFSANNVGDGSGTLTDGTGTGSGNVTAPLMYGAFDYWGTATSSRISGIFEFTESADGAGKVELTKQVPTQNSSWGEVKDLYQK
ncbi:MAG: hypothetical protein ABIF77_03905 [bacterium]